MTRDEAVQEMKDMLSFRTDQDAYLARQLKRAQEYYEARPLLPDFLISERFDITTTAGEERIPTPAEFLREIEEDAIYYIASSADQDGFVGERPLVKKDLDDLREAYSDYSGSLTPKNYAFDGTYFRVFPVDSDNTYKLKMMFYKKDDELSSGSAENRWLKKAPYLIIARALYWAAIALRDRDAKQAATEMLSSEENNYLWASELRESTNRRYAMGETL